VAAKEAIAFDLDPRVASRRGVAAADDAEGGRELIPSGVYYVGVFVADRFSGAVARARFDGTKGSHAAGVEHIGVRATLILDGDAVREKGAEEETLRRRARASSPVLTLTRDLDRIASRSVSPAGGAERDGVASRRNDARVRALLDDVNALAMASRAAAAARPSMMSQTLTRGSWLGRRAAGVGEEDTIERQTAQRDVVAVLPKRRRVLNRTSGDDAAMVKLTAKEDFALNLQVSSTTWRSKQVGAWRKGGGRGAPRSSPTRRVLACCFFPRLHSRVCVVLIFSLSFSFFLSFFLFFSFSDQRLRGAARGGIARAAIAGDNCTRGGNHASRDARDCGAARQHIGWDAFNWRQCAA